MLDLGSFVKVKDEGTLGGLEKQASKTGLRLVQTVSASLADNMQCCWGQHVGCIQILAVGGVVRSCWHPSVVETSTFNTELLTTRKNTKQGVHTHQFVESTLLDGVGKSLHLSLSWPSR